MIFPVVLLGFSALCRSSSAEEYHKPQPYSFGYVIKDKESIQHRNEAGDGHGNVKGNYGFIDNKGIHRIVTYEADKSGFKAKIKTNEPGTTGENPASVNLISNDPYAHGAARPYNSKVDVPHVPALYESDGKTGFPTVHDFHKYKIDHEGDDDNDGNDEKSSGYSGSNNVGHLVPINLLGHRYKQGGTVYFGANLVGGRVTGYDSRFSRR